MSPSYAEVEDRLRRSYCAFVADIPDHPLASWSAFTMTSDKPSRHRHRVIGVAASVVLIVVATISWASPSAGAHYHGAEVLRTGSPGISKLYATDLCTCASSV